jgi:hypothetical protein
MCWWRLCGVVLDPHHTSPKIVASTGATLNLLPIIPDAAVLLLLLLLLLPLFKVMPHLTGL